MKVAGNVQTCKRAVHGHVPKESFLALVHWRRNGRDGIHGS